MTDEPSEIERDTAWFFNFYRQRLANVAALASGDLKVPIGRPEVAASFDPEVHVLVAAGLDSLARHWGHTFNKGLGARTRMGEFLAIHGGHAAFLKCSAPHLLLRAKAFPDLIPAVRRYLGNEKFTGGNVRHWHHDPDYAVVAADPPFASVDRKPFWPRSSRYGELLYTEYRTSWLHEYRASINLASDHEESDRIEPSYENMNWSRPRPGRPSRMQRPRFTKGFLLATYNVAIESFERECRSAGVAPKVD